MKKKPSLDITVHTQELYTFRNGQSLLPFPILNSVAKTCLFSNILENLLKARVYPLSFESFEKTTQILHKSANKFPNFYNRVWCQNLHRDGKCRDGRPDCCMFSINTESSRLHLYLTRISATNQSTNSRRDSTLAFYYFSSLETKHFQTNRYCNTEFASARFLIHFLMKRH